MEWNWPFGNGLFDSNTPIQAGQKIIRINDSLTLFHGKSHCSDGAANDQSGISVSQSGNILAVGAYSADPGGLTDAGAAYLYQIDSNGSTTYLTKVTAPDGDSEDYFGYSVSQSGNILAVGAYGADPGGLTGAGATYLYQLDANGSATYLTKVTAPDGAAGDAFGISVSQSGNLLAVGAFFSDPDGLAEAGSVYLYEIESNGTVALLSKIMAPNKFTNDGFGRPVHLSGNILSVGARGRDDGVNDSGAVYLFSVESDNSITHLAQLSATDRAASDGFGTSIIKSGNFINVGVASSDAASVSNSGAVYRYRLDSDGTPTFHSKLTAPVLQNGAQFGFSLSQYGNLLAVGRDLMIRKEF